MATIRNKIVTKISRTLKAIRAISSIPKQLKVAEKLDAYIADFLNGKIEKFIAVPKKSEWVGKTVFWQYWHQGVDSTTSKMVVACINSVNTHSRDYHVMLLTDKTAWDYIELPDFVFEKIGKNGFKFAQLSDLARLYLLSAYGGVWLDATIYLTKPIEERMLDKDFFAFQRSEIPPPDAEIYRKFDPLYFSWDSRFQARMLNAFMIAKPNNKIVSDMLSILLAYWKKEKRVGQYYFFQICFNRMMLHDEWKNLNCEIVGDTDCHKLQVVSQEKFDRQLFDEIKSKSNIHKLTYRFDRLGQIPKDSFFDFIANGKIETEGK